MSKKLVIFSSAAIAFVIAAIVLVFYPSGSKSLVVPVEAQVITAAQSGGGSKLTFPQRNALNLLPVSTVTWKVFSNQVNTQKNINQYWLQYSPPNNSLAGVILDPMGDKILVTSPPSKEAMSNLGLPYATTLPDGENKVLGVKSATSGSSSGFKIDPSSPWVVFGFPLLLIAVLIGAMRFMNVGGAAGSAKFSQFGGEKNDAIETTRFSDVAGVDEAVEEVSELVDILKDPEKYASKGVALPKGALLIGPPGTGKTMLAKAIAGEAGVPFYATSGADFVEMYVGVGAARVRSLFNKAKKHPEGAIVFIDEVDALGKARKAGTANGGGTDSEQEGALNALLVELDGFNKNYNIIVIGATNRPELLDDALKRPGRLERIITVPLPDRRGREKILYSHINKKNLLLADDVDISTIAYRTPGMSGAELARVVNEACLKAVKDDRIEVGVEDFDHAVATVVMGKARTSAVVSEQDKTITAWHEAGHTVAAMVLPETDDPVSVSIVPRGQAGGITWMSGNDDQYLSRKKAYARLIVSMAGRAAEEKLLDGEFTSGPHGDLQAATNLAFVMVTKYGMTGESYVSNSDDLGISQTFAFDKEVKTAVNDMLIEALDKARILLTENEQLFSTIVEQLLIHETLTHVQLAEIKDSNFVSV